MRSFWKKSNSGIHILNYGKDYFTYIFNFIFRPDNLALYFAATQYHEIVRTAVLTIQIDRFWFTRCPENICASLQRSGRRRIKPKHYCIYFLSRMKSTLSASMYICFQSDCLRMISHI